MDKRIKKPISSDEAFERREQFYKDVLAGKLSIGQAVSAMRKMSRLTQSEFAAHRGISTAALRQIEQENGNPTVETLNKIGAIFGLEIGFVPKRVAQATPD